MISSERKPENPQFNAPDPKARYKSALLNKFEKRTNDRIIQQMRKRDTNVITGHEHRRTRQQSEEVNNSSYNPAITKATVSNNADSVDRKNNHRSNSKHNYSAVS